MICLQEKDLAGLVYLFACVYSVSTGTLGLNLSFYFTFSDYITSHSRLLRSNQLLWWLQVRAVAHNEAEGAQGLQWRAAEESSILNSKCLST